jgi:methyl-accepting chemotaxis protein
MWVVDSSQVGLQSVQYYTEAISIAARELNETGKGLVQHWERADIRSIQQALERILVTSQYIANATQYQQSSNYKLATALKVATQVTEQLMAGATSATDAATQLEGVVTQLRSVVGK